MRKRVLSLLIIAVTFLGFVSCTGNNEGTVPYRLKISCDEVISNLDNEVFGITSEKRNIVPKNGIILDVQAKCDMDDNVFDSAVKILQKNKVHFEGKDGYFTAIGNIYAGDCGDFSGWMFFVNGNLAELGASDTIIKENDVIEFKYIVDYNTLFE